MSGRVSRFEFVVEPAEFGLVRRRQLGVTVTAVVDGQRYSQRVLLPAAERAGGESEVAFYGRLAVQSLEGLLERSLSATDEQV